MSYTSFFSLFLAYKKKKKFEKLKKTHFSSWSIILLYMEKYQQKYNNIKAPTLNDESELPDSFWPVQYNMKNYQQIFPLAFASTESIKY